MSATIFRVALLFFLLAASMGLLLRWAFVGDLPWMHYRFWVHAHSHVALLGWLYLGVYALLSRVLVPEALWSKPAYRWNVMLTAIAVAGMAVAFPIQGYGGWAIAFSVMHGLLSYHWAWHLWRDSRAEGAVRQFTGWAIVFLILGSLALWALPVIILTGYQGKAIYYMAVQWYLHFQFNGWLLFACLALFFQWAHDAGAIWPTSFGSWFLRLMIVSCFLTYALAIAWSHPGLWVFLVNSAGVILQLAALIVLVLGVKKVLPAMERLADTWTKVLLGVAAGSFVLKILIQSVVVAPYIATISFTIRNFVLGFIHLILLGVVSFFLFAQARHLGWLKLNRRVNRLGLILLLIGFIGTECWLFLQGTLFWGSLGFLPLYYEVLFALSAFLPAGIALLLYDQARLSFSRK